MDQIIINVEVFAYHGVYHEEQEKGQKFIIKVCLFLDVRNAGKSDNLKLTVDYADVSSFVAKLVSNKKYMILETVAEKLCREILLKYDKIKAVSISILKPNPPMPSNIKLNSASINIKRRWHQVFLGVGSNVGDKQKNIHASIEYLKKCQDIRIDIISRMIETKPYGNPNMDDVLNGVIKIKTLLTPYELLDMCRYIEQKIGRERSIKWGPRTIDLDILFYDNIIIDDPELNIPHLGIEKRYFVLKPMAEIAPNFVHPSISKTIKTLMYELNVNNE